MKSQIRRGVYPGSFNPPTRAHLAITEAARRGHGLDEITWTVSTVALAKETVHTPLLEHRLEVLTAVSREVPWLHVVTTEAQLIADIATGFDVVIMGADKWHQIQDVRFYASPAARDAALARLPTVAVAPRSGATVPVPHRLDVTGFEAMSSTAARQGDRSVMLPAAQRFDEETGAWTEPDRYHRWLKKVGDGS